MKAKESSYDVAYSMMEAQIDFSAAAARLGLNEEEMRADVHDVEAGSPEPGLPVRKAISIAKVLWMLEWVAAMEERAEPAVVFSSYAETLAPLKDRSGWGVIEGTATDAERFAIAEAFQKGALRGVAATMRCVQGLSLTRACRVLLVDRDPVLAVNDQVVMRVHREGQTRNVYVTRIIARP